MAQRRRSLSVYTRVSRLVNIILVSFLQHSLLLLRLEQQIAKEEFERQQEELEKQKKAQVSHKLF